MCNIFCSVFFFSYVSKNTGILASILYLWEIFVALADLDFIILIYKILKYT